ncbi:hypothetical protein Tcan_15676 [Toxocara canis]|uniref:Uncharacterized protein n=1 Tax=Toxocara canis TaxID=6265 RepID=A0A0B2UVZ6_TOXCA|nr:hypothetical protein Tcan_15676 [Toxocara canis]
MRNERINLSEGVSRLCAQGYEDMCDRICGICGGITYCERLTAKTSEKQTGRNNIKYNRGGFRSPWVVFYNFVIFRFQFASIP